MPRRSQTQQEVVEHTFVLPDMPFQNVVKPYLRDTYFEMCKETRRKMECSICLEDIDCRKCLTLMNCGHTLHMSCYMAQQTYTCPLCRA